MNLFLRSLLLCVIGFALFSSIPLAYMPEFRRDAFFYMLMFSILGAVFGLLSTYYHINRVKCFQYDDLKEAIHFHHIRNVTLDIPFENAFILCVDSVKNLKYPMKFVEEDEPKGKLSFEVETDRYELISNYVSHYDYIRFELSEKEDKSIEVRVSCGPLARFTYLDNGRNLENILNIVAYLKEG